MKTPPLKDNGSGKVVNLEIMPRPQMERDRIRPNYVISESSAEAAKRVAGTYNLPASKLVEIAIYAFAGLDEEAQAQQISGFFLDSARRAKAHKNNNKR